VIVGDGGRAAGPTEPVREAAEPDQEAERRGDRGHDHVRVAGLLGLDDLKPGDRAERHDEPESEGAADEEAEQGSRHSGVLQCRWQVNDS